MDFEYLSRERDRHGNARLYVRRNGKRVRLRELEGTPAFAAEYLAAIERLGGQAPGRRAPVTAAVSAASKGTLGWLAAEYFKSRGAGEFLLLAPESRRARRNAIEECLRIGLSDEDPEPMRNCPLKYLSAQKVKRMIESAEGPGARANRRKHLSALCAWGVENKFIPSNYVRDVKAGRHVKGAGYYTWTNADVRQFLDYYGPGTKARLALGLLLFTGARRQDVVTFGRQHVKGDWLQYVPLKTKWRRRDVAQKPLLPVLREIIATSPCGLMTFLETEQGKPFTPAGFGNWFRDRCDASGLPMCTAHGLKKAGATIAAENGATTRQLMAMFDWDTPSMAEVYTRSAEKKRLAGDAMFLISLDKPYGHPEVSYDPRRDHGST